MYVCITLVVQNNTFTKKITKVADWAGYYFPSVIISK